METKGCHITSIWGNILYVYYLYNIYIVFSFFIRLAALVPQRKNSNDKKNTYVEYVDDSMYIPLYT